MAARSLVAKTTSQLGFKRWLRATESLGWINQKSTRKENHL